MEYFNELTPAELERLALLSEECGEVIQAIGKIMRHGYESNHPDRNGTNRMELISEIGHVVAAINLMELAHDIDTFKIGWHTKAKAKAVKQYLHHQE